MRRFSKAPSAALRRLTLLGAVLCAVAAHHGKPAQDVREHEAARNGKTVSAGEARLDEFSPEFRALRIHVARPLVKIEVINQDGSYSLGTGVVVAPGKAVTNCHVTRSAARIHVLWGGLRYQVRAQAADAGHDLCALHAPRLEVAAATLAPAPARAGQFVLAAGFVGGQGLQVAQGEIVALHALDGGKVIQSTTAFTSGASGGGLFNARGELLGILTFRLRGASAHYFAVPAQWISSALLDTAKAVKIAPIKGLAFWQAQGQALPYFLQAAPLQAGHRWEELLQLSQRWAQVESRNAEPWLARAQAYLALNRSQESWQALRKAVEIDPQFELAWYQLGLAHAQDCERAELERIVATLERLDQQLSARLLQAAHTSNESRPKNLAC